MATRTRDVAPAAGQDRYFALVCRFPLRPIRSKTAYAEANRLYHDLIARDSELDQQELDYANILGRLIRDFDAAHAAVLQQSKGCTPIELLRFLMEQRGMKTTDLGTLVGGRGHASLILRGKRELSKSNIRTLAAFFHVTPAAFF